MLRLVMKFGGTSVGSVERINDVANIVRNEVVQGNEVVVVLSASSSLAQPRKTKLIITIIGSK